MKTNGYYTFRFSVIRPVVGSGDRKGLGAVDGGGGFDWHTPRHLLPLSG